MRLLSGILLATALTGTWAAAANTKSYRGKVTAIQGRKLHIAVSDGSTGDWTVADKATIGSGKQRFPLSEIKVGDEVSVAVSEDGVIHTLGVLHGGKPAVHAKGSHPAGAPKPAKGMWGEASKDGKYRWWRGEVVSVDEKTHEIQIKRTDGGGQGTTHFKADPSTKIVRAGKPPQKAAFGDLKAGETVEAVAAKGRTSEINIMR